MEEQVDNMYYMQFSYKVLEIMKCAKSALTHVEYEMFVRAVQRLIDEGIYVDN